MDIEFENISLDKQERINALSRFASSIIRDYYDPIIGKKQNDYHLSRFQSVEGIKGQLQKGHIYYFIRIGDTPLGFLSYYPKGKACYLSKFYLHKDHRGKGYGKKMLLFLIKKAKEMGLSAIELNVNRFNPTTAIYEHFGFIKIKEEKADIGEGFIMDDYVYSLDLSAF